MSWSWFENMVRRIPSRCAVCHAWPSQAVCEACVNRFAQPCARCRTCALPLVTGQVQCAACIRTLPPWDDALTAVAYEYPWSQLVVDFKFRQEPGWARNMALLMRSAPWVEPALDAADLLVPMPLSHQRLRERGFNQALLLARALSAHKTHPRLLIRIKDTPAQSSLPRAARLANVQHAFATDPLRQAEVEGRRVVLIDDVMTSGASLGAAARSLRQAGAVHITTLVFARAEPGH